MKLSLRVSNLCLIFLFLSCLTRADIFSTSVNNVRMEVIDYRDFLEDIIFWIHHIKDTPVVPQKLINQGFYPISVTIYNESNKTIKVIKNAVGGLSVAGSGDAAQIYQYNALARVAKKASLGIVGTLIGLETLNILSDGNAQLTEWKDNMTAVCETWYKRLMYASSSACALVTGMMHWSETAAANALIDEAFKSHLLPEVSLIDPGCSMTFLMFANQAPSGYTLKVPIFDGDDHQIVLLACPFPST